MKRALELEPGSSLTPSKSAARFKKPPAKSVSKRPRIDIRSFCTPTLPVDGTPATCSKKTAAPVSAWPSSAMRQFETLGIYTPKDNATPEGSTGPGSLPPKQLQIEDIQEDDDGFILFSQSDYIRGSQAVLTPEATPEVQHSADTQAASTSVFNFPSQASTLLDLKPIPMNQTSLLNTQPSVTSVVQPEADQALAAPSQHQTDFDFTTYHDPARQPSSSCFSEDHLSQPPSLPAAEAHTAVTPELCCAVMTCDAKQAEQLPPNPKTTPMLPKMFNIFLPRSVQKHVLIIRHGESEYNRAVHDVKGFGDPLVFDPHLTSLGMKQSRALRPRLQEQLKLHGQALWVVSPLKRAIETFMEACPLLEGRRASAATPGASGSGSSSSSSSSPALGMSMTPVANQGGQLDVHLLPTIAEFVSTPGDVGTPSSVLAKEFPQLAAQLSGMPEHWWFQGPKKPNCALAKQFHSSEPKEHRQKRVNELVHWLSTRPERFIIMIGHSAFWHEFRGRSEKRMENGEMRSMSW